MKAAKSFSKKDVIVILLCVVFVVLTGGAIGRGGREHARMVICSSRLRQLGLATHDYGIDTGYMPVYGVYEGPSIPFMYAHSDPIVGPPTDEIPWVTDWYDPNCRGTPGACLIRGGSLEDANVFDQACPTSSSIIRLSYGYNHAMLGSSSRPGAYAYMDGDEWIKFSSVQTPAETGMYCDSAAVFGLDNRPYDEPPRTGNWGIYFWEPSLWPDYEDVGIFSNQAIIGHRDGTLVNIGFVDGHVEAMPPGDIHFTTTHDWYDPKIYIWLRDKRFAATDQPW